MMEIEAALRQAQDGKTSPTDIFLAFFPVGAASCRDSTIELAKHLWTTARKDPTPPGALRPNGMVEAWNIGGKVIF